jgi:hypothetical protein
MILRYAKAYYVAAALALVASCDATTVPKSIDATPMSADAPATPDARVVPDAMPASGLSFFLTSANPGNGANLGGLAGADAYCRTLAEAAGTTGKTWKAYLSASTENARDRIGTGPWKNALGVVVATSVANLHSANNQLSKANSVDETGAVVKGAGDTPNRHDIMTGSNETGVLQGTACNDWTSAGAGSTMVGHHDRQGGGAAPTSWNAAHASSGCSLANLRATGGDGLFYCFATN